MPIHLQLRATRGWMGSVTFQSLYPLHRAWYLLHRWLNGPGVRSGGFDPWTVHPVASRYTHYASVDFTRTYQNWSRASKTETGRLVMMSAVRLSILSLSLSIY